MFYKDVFFALCPNAPIDPPPVIPCSLGMIAFTMAAACLCCGDYSIVTAIKSFFLWNTVLPKNMQLFSNASRLSFQLTYSICKGTDPHDAADMDFL